MHDRVKENFIFYNSLFPPSQPHVNPSQRTKTLGMEYKKRHKKNTFVDERFGVADEALSLEDKMMARFTAERQKHHGKQRFNLEDDVLTHKGQSIDQMEEFDDVYSSGDDDGL